MKFIKQTLTLLAAVTLLASCGKDDDNGSSTPATPNYQPTKAGSTWTYQAKDLIASTTLNYVLTATAKDTTYNSRPYRVFTRSTGGSEYYFVTGTDYFQYGRFDALGTDLELLYLKAALAVNGTWEENKTIMIGATPLAVKFTFKIAEKDITYTVAGKAYPRVTRVNVVLSAPGVPIAAQDINYYYADGVGRIFSKILLSVPLAGVNTSTETSLTAYTIVP